MSSSTGSTDLVSRVEAVLEKASTGKDRPTDADLGPCYSLLIPSPSTPSSSNPIAEHWYCEKARSELHRRAAGYLLFLFAFKRSGQSKEWVDRLEIVLRGCVGCARGFGIARRAFGDLYMSTFPHANKVNFFVAVDRWQATFILEEAARLPGAGYASTSSDTTGLAGLSAPATQLLFAEPSLLEIEDIASFVDTGIARTPSTVLSSVVSLGITPSLIRMLRSTDAARRDWAKTQLAETVRRKVSFEILVRTGVRDEIEELCRDQSVDGTIRWGAVRDILRSGGLSDEAVTRGLLAGEGLAGGRQQGGQILASLVPVLGTQSDRFPLLLEVFSLLLSACPNRSFWTFDTSPELPHTLASDIRNNASFRAMLDAAYGESAGRLSPPFIGNNDGKGKEKRESGVSPFSWISDFLLSLVTVSSPKNPNVTEDSGFSEAAARIMGDLLQDLQHERFDAKLRAAAAQAGLDALSVLQQRSGPMTPKCEMALHSALDLHAKFITAVAFRPSDYPLPTWAEAQGSARDLLMSAFRADTKDIVESMLGLSVIASTERKRHQLARKAKQKGEPPPAAVPVESLHRASVRKDLWAMAYNALSPTDAPGTAIMLNSMATYAHVEKLNRDDTWSYSGLRLNEVVKEEDFVSAVRAINAGIVASRDPFARAIESMAMQADLSIVKRLWDQPGVAKSAVILLLSPAEEVHDPTISLIQQSFDNVDDRADCFRVLLTKYPAAAMDGLCNFLVSFIDTAKITPESCSLAKWLVRCFTDILEALCQASEDSEPLLQSSAFLASYADGLPMSRRVANLWHLMTNALAVIFKRTVDWAPFYDNETMVDWMRDALIFGRHMADHIRAFEAAALGVVGSRFDAESPAKTTTTGTKLVQKLEVVLRDLVSWLRLTDVETLHQTYELIRTIVGRLAKVTPDIKKSPDLEITLLELDKFSRKASKSYRTRLSDDLLSELSDMLTPFNLDIEDDEDIQYVKSVATAQPAGTWDDPAPLSAQPSRGSTAIAGAAKPAVKPKNAFEEMMRRAGGSVTPSSSPASIKARSSAQQSTSSSKQQPEVVEVDDDDFDDGFLDDISAADLDTLEQGAKSSASTPAKPKTATPAWKVPPRPPAGQQALKFLPKMTSSSTAAGQKLNINVTPRAPPKPAATTSFKSQFMKDARLQHRQAHLQRDRNIGGITPKTPAASGLGTGLGAYQGPRKPVKPLDSGSSASESSDEERQGVRALAARQKSPKKVVRAPQPERRRMQVLGGDMSELLRQREDKRAAQHNLKMRLKPDLNGLYRYVLAWDPDHTGQQPPHPPQYAREIGALGQVPTTFGDCTQYRKVMLPLFLQELWMQCLKDTSNAGYLPVEVASRAYEDDFLDMEITVLGNMPNDFRVNETDVVVLRCLGTNTKAVLAKVQGFRRKFGKDGAIKLRILSSCDQRELGVKSRWHLQKHVSLSTALREYGALQGLPYYDQVLLMNILGARSARIPSLDEDDVKDAIKAFECNEPQARAILGAMSVEGFALIQGPPGTGKTKTISGLVGKWMSDRNGIIPLAGDKPTKTKLLVCAPSNAAIDEVCKRLMNGVPSSSGGQHHPTIVRIGIESSVNIAVKSVSLDSLVEARVTSSGGGKDGGGDYQRIQADLDEVKRQITAKHDELSKVGAGANDEKRKQLENEYHSLIQRRTQLGHQSSKAKDAARDATRHLEGARRAAKEAILNEADIVCATLSGAGQDSLAQFGFETVIIDEAAQAIEMSCLIPLKYGCKRCIMVGDPNQLPPTTFSSDAERFHYNESLFVRMVKQNPKNVQLLSIQYRMNPYISELPSKVFYNGKLEDGPGMAAKTRAVWHDRAIFGPYRFFNVEGLESKAGTSTKNTDEAYAAVDLYKRLEDEFGDRVNFAMRIGVISMYKEQLWELKRKFMDVYGTGILERIEFNTVDGFQGQEKDIIILSCVRSGPNLQTIGFLKDVRRMNVALTRAKSSLFIIGNGATLERSDERWRAIVQDAKQRGFYADYGPDTFSKGRPEPVAKMVKKEKSSPVKPVVANAKGERPPVEEMYSAQPLKRKSEDVKKADKADKANEKKRKTSMVDVGGIKIEREEGGSKAEKRKASDGRSADGAPVDDLERKKKKKNKDKDRVKGEQRDSSPANSVASTDSKASATARPQSKGSSSVNGMSTPNSYSGRPNGPPPPPTSRPPDIPPPPPSTAGPSNPTPSAPRPPQPRLPPPPPARKPEDVLFLKKKKKPGQPGFGAAANRAPIQNVRATFKEQFSAPGSSRP